MRIYWAWNPTVGLGLSWELRRSVCARNGNQQIMQHRERGSERVVAGKSEANSFQSDFTLPFPFLSLTGMLGRNSPYTHFVYENTEAQETEVTSPWWMVLDSSPSPGPSILHFIMLLLEKNQMWSLALSSPPPPQLPKFSKVLYWSTSQTL